MQTNKKAFIKVKMIIALTNSKGGVGKTTLAVHLAVWLHEQGNRVEMIDADVQESSSRWMFECCPEIPIHRFHTPDEVLEKIDSISEKSDFIIADGPAGLSEVTRTLLLKANLTLLPCGPSALDLRAVQDAIKVVRQAQNIRNGPPDAILIPNKLQTQYRLSKELIETAKNLGIPSIAGLKLRQAFADSVGQGTVVWKLPKATEAAKEVIALFQELNISKYATKS